MLHPKNKHTKDYDFKALCEVFPRLKDFVFVNNYGNETINFAKPEAVKALNTALLKKYYGIEFWEFPNENLCPPIPGRVDYIHHLADLLKSDKVNENINILDIGTGATCIYPLLGNATYGWKFTGTDIDKTSLECAQKIINENKLENFIELRRQPSPSNIFKGIINNQEIFSASMCNPPFYKSAAEASKENLKKTTGLGLKNKERNFSGIANELHYTGGEKAFVHNYLYESSLFKTKCKWFSTLVSKKENVKSMYHSLKKLGATEIKTIPMTHGNKITRIVAWTFLP